MIEADPQPHKEDTPLTFNIQQNAKQTKKFITKSTLVSACLLLWADIVGVGPLASGYYMANGGVWFTVATIFLVAFTSDYTLSLMFELVHKYRQPNYIEMCAYALGRRGRFFASLFIFTYNFTGLVANLLVIGSAVPALLSKAIGKDYLVFHREFVLAFAAAMLLPVAFRKDIARFAISCAVTIAFFLAAVGLILYSCITANFDDHFKGFKGHLSFVEPYYVQVLGGICYIFVCHDMAFSIAATLIRPTRRRWSGVVRTCICANSIISLAVGLLSYAIFTEGTKPFIPVLHLDNYGSDSNLMSFVRLFILLMIISSVPFLCYLPRLALYQIVHSIVGTEGWTIKAKKEILLHVSLTLITPIGALVLAELVTDLGTVLSIAGGFAAAGIGFIMPPAVFLKLEDGDWYSYHKLPYVAILLFGLFSISLTIYSATTMIFSRP